VGAVQDVTEARLPKSKKGRAYVDFATEEQLQNALKLHNTTWRDAKLSVLRSAPPGRGAGPSTRGGKHAGRGKGRGKAGLGFQKEPSEHPHSRLGTTMVPRAVSKADGAPAQTNAETGSKAPKDNSDFKALLGLS
jgi:RNA recognition motif-containing protein